MNQKTIYDGPCFCGESGKDGTINHRGAQVKVTNSHYEAMACENHVNNYTDAGWELKGGIDKTTKAIQQFAREAAEEIRAKKVAIALTDGGELFNKTLEQAAKLVEEMAGIE